MMIHVKTKLLTCKVQVIVDEGWTRGTPSHMSTPLDALDSRHRTQFPFFLSF